MLSSVARLASTLSARGWGRRPAFYVRWISGRGPRGVGGVPVEPLPEVIYLLLEGAELLLILPDERQDRCPSARWDCFPEFSGDRRQWLHAADLRARPV